MRLALLACALLLPVAAAAQECADYSAEPDRLAELEDAAGRGSLTGVQIQCLEDGYAAAESQTTKDKISRVLLVNAYAYSTSWWAELVARHLEEVDRSDPDIAYLYAFYLFNREGPDYEEVIQWTDVALERRQVWTGDLHVHRTYKLLEARTYAAYGVWEGAEVARSDDAEDQRNRTKTYAREWLDFARSSGQDTVLPEEFCVQVASRHACGISDG